MSSVLTKIAEDGVRRDLDVAERGGIERYLAKNQRAIQSALGDRLDAGRFSRMLMTEINRQTSAALKRKSQGKNASTILDCDPASVVGAMMRCAELQLYPGPLGHVHLIKYGSECQVIVGYQGFRYKAMATGLVREIQTHVVYRGDEFEWDQTSTPPLVTHRPDIDGDLNPDDLRCVYGFAVLPNGQRGYWTLMRGAEVRKIRQMQFDQWASKRWNQGKSVEQWDSPWQKWQAEMWSKTCIRRMWKSLPQTDDLGVPNALSDAVQADGQTIGGWNASGPVVTHDAEIVSDNEGATAGVIELAPGAPMGDAEMADIRAQEQAEARGR